MKAALIPYTELERAGDWRPMYHFSPAAALPKFGAGWPKLDELSCEVLDGWRFSDNPESDWYLKHVELKDLSKQNTLTGNFESVETTKAEKEKAEQFRAAIDNQLFYRMRHIEPMQIALEPQLMAQPAVEQEPYCIAPHDVLIRRVGSVAAAYVSPLHRAHPIDANLAIIRGLDSAQAIWLTYCLNQRIYKDFLAQQVGVSSLVRVGLKQLEQTPIGACPDAFLPLAKQFSERYQAILQAEEALFNLRQTVNSYVSDALDEKHQYLNKLDKAQKQGVTAKFFRAQDISEQLLFDAAEQAQLARKLTQEQGFKTLSELAELNPRSSGYDQTQTYPVVKISHLDGQQSVELPTESSSEAGWRTHKRLLQNNDVLVSTFAQDPKVAAVLNVTNTQLQISEQLAVVKFHHSPGAYALLMETPLIKKQVAWLATGSIQRFIQPSMLNKIVMPEIERDTANKWHQQLVVLQQAKVKSTDELKSLYKEMHKVYRSVHPDIENTEVLKNQGGRSHE